MFTLYSLPALQDNYIWLLGNQHNEVVIIDPSAADPVLDFLKNRALTPVAILLTHHHSDHTAGVPKLAKLYPSMPIYGPDEIELPAVRPVSETTPIIVSDFVFSVFNVPGHTLGHVAYYQAPYLFCGDTLFSAGCGRVFEGTMAQMYQSVSKLRKLPDETLICASHEYTLNNLRFAHAMLPDDPLIITYLDNVSQRRQQQQMTLPSKLKIEKGINLFLRCDDVNLKNKFNINNELNSDVDLFTFFRTQKDKF